MSAAGWGLALASILSIIGHFAGWLTIDGTIAAALVGGAVFAGGGIPGGILLALFFVSGSILTQINHSRGHPDPAAGVKQGRNARQVCANGLWAAIGALLIRGQPAEGWAIVTGALTAAQSDTWATEFGVLSTVRPRSIVTWRLVETGSSGGVTVLGTLGGVLGGLVLLGAALGAGVPRFAAVAGLAGGLLGMVADSLLGASLQGRFYCDRCNQKTELRTHRCGTPTRRLAGLRWLDNDGVNLLATGAGGSAALLISSWL